MAVFAHADDETTISPLLVKYKREGAEVHLIVATDGRQGVRPHFGVPPGDSLAGIRKSEIQDVAHKLGVSSLVLLNLEDGTLANPASFNILRTKIDSLYNLMQPDIIFTWGPDGGTGHPDHRTIFNITTEVFQSYPFDNSRKLLLFGLTKKAIGSIPVPKTNLGQLLQSSWKTLDSYYLNYPLVVEEHDLKTGREALGYHKSQFTNEEMDDFYSILHQNSDTIYFRNWQR